MLKKVLLSAASALALLGSFSVALAQVAPPQVSSVGGSDLFQDIVGGYAQQGNVYASGALLSGTFGGGGENYLIGGDFTQNLFQRGTGAITMGTGATVIYGADRFFGWQSVAGSTSFTTARSSLAAALPTGVKYALAMVLANSQTGTAQVCIGQEIPSSNALFLAGHTVALDYNMYVGATATFTAVNSYIIYGTDAAGDNGSANMAFGLNANSVSSTAWAGQTSATSGLLSGLAVSTAYKPLAVASIPSTATEIGIAICYTPSGTTSGSGGTDGIYLSNLELRKADFLSGFVNSTTAYNALNPVSLTANGVTQYATIPNFSKREQTREQLLQYAFYYQWNDETTANLPIGPAGYYNSTTACEIDFPLPAPLFKAPTIVNSAITTSTFTVAQSGGTPAAGAALAGTGNSGLILTVGSNTTAVTTPATVAALNHATLSFITAAKTQYAACQLLSTNSTTAWFAVNAEE